MDSSAQCIHLISSDDVTVPMDVKMAAVSSHINDLIEDCGTEKPIVFSNIESQQLKKIVEYCSSRWTLDGMVADANKDEEFIDIPNEELFKLAVAADFLHIKPLIQLCCATIADRMRGKKVDELREMFNITERFTEEEEEMIKKEREYWME